MAAMSENKVENLKEKAKAALKDGTIHGDGHSILSLEAYAPHFTVADLGPLVRTYKSDRSSVKSTIWDRNGNPMHEARGCSGSARRSAATRQSRTASMAGARGPALWSRRSHAPSHETFFLNFFRGVLLSAV